MVKKNRIKVVSLTLVLLLLVPLLLTECAKSGMVCVGSKDSTESILLGEIFSQLIEEKTNLAVTRKLGLGGTSDCFEAMQAGEIDIYPEYTGTGLMNQLQMAAITDPDEAYLVVSKEFSEQFHMTWLDPIGFNNRYAIAVSNDAYQRYGLESCSDLASARKSLVFGAEPVFFEQKDGFEELCTYYEIEFLGDPQRLSAQQKYKAIGRGDIDATIVRATDAQIAQYNLKVLADDKGFFPSYDAAPVIRSEKLDQYPELGAALNSLSGLLNEATMTELNEQVDLEGQDIPTVARTFLQEQGLVKS